MRTKVAQTVSPPKWEYSYFSHFDHRPTWILSIPKLSQSINRTHGTHWSIPRKEREEWARWLAVSIDKPPKATGKRALIIERYACSNGLDRDNLYGSYKQLIDAIKAVGLIVDDSDEWLDLRIVNQRAEARAYAHTLIVLGEA